MKTNKGSWYYVASVGHFGGFFFENEIPSQIEQQSWGPFKTLSEAKKDAIDYFKTDIVTAKLAIESIRECAKRLKKPVEARSEDPGLHSPTS